MAKMAGFASFDKNADARMINLEKAVTRMHLSLRTQMGNTETVDQSIADSELRLTELEDSVSKLRVESGTVIASAKPADTNNQNTEQLQQMLEDITDQLQAMQQTSQQAMQQSIQQTSQPVPRSVQSRSANRNISVKTDVQQLRVHGKLTRLEGRIDTMEQGYRLREEHISKELTALRNYIDSLLDELY